MKKFLAVFTALSLISSLSAFEDKPALGRIERAALIAAKGVGTVAGVYAGLRRGIGRRRLNLKGVDKDLDVALKAQRKAYARKRLGLAAVGLGVGGYLGYKGGKSLAILALAKLHGVSYRIEAISQYYNINVSQYKPILVAAAAQDPEILLQAIDEVYTQRFGEQWKEKLPKLFKKYRKRAPILIKESSFIRKGNLKDFLRMVELGAAMANLYFGTNPNKEYTVNSAIEFYQELELLK